MSPVGDTQSGGRSLNTKIERGGLASGKVEYIESSQRKVGYGGKRFHQRTHHKTRTSPLQLLFPQIITF